MKKMVIAVAVSMIMGSFAAAEAVVWNNMEALQETRVNGRSSYYGSALKVEQKAQEAMNEAIPLITDKETVPPSGDKRDYMSIAVYYWPDQSKPDGLPYIRHDGKVNPERNDVKRFDAARRDHMVRMVRALSRGYAVTGKEEYAARAVKILSAWFIDDATAMRPRLEYAQIVPGRSSGRHWGLLDTAGFIELIDDTEILKGSKAYTPEVENGLKSWFSRYTDWLISSEKGRGEAAAPNNHGTWYDAQTAVFAHFVGRDDIAREILQAVPEKRMEKQLAKDASQPLELARTRPVHYSCFNLRAYMTLARLGKELGIDLYSVKTTSGVSLKDAVNFILPYAEGKKAMNKKETVKEKAFLKMAAMDGLIDE